MSAPPPVGRPGTPAYLGNPYRRPESPAVAPDIYELFAVAARAQQAPRRQAARPRQQAVSAPGKPYRRADNNPRGLTLTADQWKRYDEWNRLQDRMEAKYGHLQMAAGILNRSIW